MDNTTGKFIPQKVARTKARHIKPIDILAHIAAAAKASGGDA